MKKRIIAVIVILAVLVALFFIGTGFQKRMDVVLVDYSVSEDGTEITLDVGIPTLQDISEDLKTMAVE